MIDNECPNCGKKALRERSTPSLKNIRLREIGNKKSPIVCDHCKTTFDVELVATKSTSADVDQNSGADW